MLDGDVLDWDSQPVGRKDHLIIEHKQLGLELLIFYREKKYEFVGAGFRFEELFDYGSHVGEGPAHFKLYRASGAASVARLQISAVNGALDVAEYAVAKTKGQGFSSSPERRIAVGLHAMSLATNHFEQLKYEVEDTSTNKPYNLVATKGAERLYIEVKGTTAGAEHVFLTKNEVAHAQAHPKECVLFIVHGIEVTGPAASPVANGGMSRVLWSWAPVAEDLLALSLKYTVPSD